ncbi:hypothetical protein SAMN04487926_15727 [Paraburkholderia steynii]|uniref:TIR domain-containing protein n=1 Tax=Paraburkholderia steynii TaxID=1245441 RepID=A0A7Z7FR91_9BURK|nr:hypothetical protein SAMN04487926_15727 [Paraburkholderia steynii]
MTAIFISHSSADNPAAAEMKAWLEAQGHTSLFLDFDPEAGIRGGAAWGHCQVEERKLSVWLKSSYPYQITCSAAVETAQPCHVARRSFSMVR